MYIFTGMLSDFKIYSAEWSVIDIENSIVSDKILETARGNDVVDFLSNQEDDWFQLERITQ